MRQQGLEKRLLAVVAKPSGAPEAWKAAAHEIGYSEAVQDNLAARLWDTPAELIVGVNGSLDYMRATSQPSVSSDEYSWPQLRSIIADLLAIDAEISSCGSCCRQVTATMHGATHGV